MTEVAARNGGRRQPRRGGGKVIKDVESGNKGEVHGMCQSAPTNCHNVKGGRRQIYFKRSSRPSCKYDLYIYIYIYIYILVNHFCIGHCFSSGLSCD